MKRDVSGHFFKYVRLISTVVLKCFSTYWMRFLLCIKGITFGKNVTFYGNAFFRRDVDSQIVIGDNCQFRSSVNSNEFGLYHPCRVMTICKGAIIEIGKNCGFSGNSIVAASSIKIGNNVMCGANVVIGDTDGHSDDDRSGDTKPIVIEDNVWIGAKSIIWKGVTIGHNSVISLNTVVMQDVPPNSIVRGNPCEIITLYTKKKK